jgi:sigma-B regulation protein RsbU (phosphoserine phosphatase)
VVDWLVVSDPEQDRPLPAVPGAQAVAGRRPELAWLGEALEAAGAGRDTETGELKRVVSELQASLTEAEAAVAQMSQLEQELALARRVQERMLPQTLPEIPGYHFATRYAPARAVGGDFYDIIALDKERFGVAIADVSGKGMPAALLMALTRSLLLSEAPHVASPRALLARMNEQLLAAGGGENFVTIFYGVVDSASGQMIYARAGHDYPVLLRDGQATDLGGDGSALGVLPGNQLKLQENELCLRAGDRLVLYSDGLTDVQAPDGCLYDGARLREVLLRHASHPPDAFCEQVFAELEDFQAGAPQYDDMTMLVFDFAPAEDKQG